MESIYNTFSGVIPGVPGAVLFWIVLAVLVTAVFVILKKSGFTGRDSGSTRSVARAIRKLCSDSISNVMIHDEVEGEIHIELMCLTPAGIAVVDIKDYRGYLFGGNNTDQWTQVIDNRSFRFENPLYRNRDKIRAIEALVDVTPVYGFVVFTSSGSFPKDQPEGVFMQEQVGDGLSMGGPKSDIAAAHSQEWQTLKEKMKPIPAEALRY